MYPIKIITYLNPHLIWAKPDNKCEEVVFEQIGVYGVLPLDVGFDIEGSLITNKATHWLPGASIILKNVFKDAGKILFCPIQSCSSSIFPNMTHKFGDIIVKKANGHKEHLALPLSNSPFAILDVSEFNDHIIHGKLKTTVTEIEAIGVKQHLKDYYNECSHDLPWDKWLYKQTADDYNTILTEGKHTQSDKIEDGKSKNCCKKIELNNSSPEYDNMPMKVKILCRKMMKLKSKSECRDMTMHCDNASIVTDSTESECDWVDGDTIQDALLNSSKNSADTSLDDSSTENESLNRNMNKFAKLAMRAQKTIRNDTNRTAHMVYGPPNYLEISSLTVKTVSLNPEDNTSSNLQQTEHKCSKEKNTDFNDNTNDRDENIESENAQLKVNNKAKNRLLLRQLYKAKLSDQRDIPASQSNYQQLKEIPKVNDVTSDDESMSDISENLKLQYFIKPLTKKNILKQDTLFENPKISANPHMNLDGSNSVFVDKLISTVLMVHTKKKNRIQPCSNIRDVPFAKYINVVLRNMGIKEPTRMQSVSWTTILRGHSVFMIGPLGCGKTMGYLPSVCCLTSDKRKQNPDSVYPFTIVLCATASSVCEVEKCSKILFGLEERVFACYAGMNELNVTTSLLNGCDMLICTPPVLVRLLQAELGVDLRALTTLVIDDCERISEVYADEIKYALFEVKKMLKNRANKEMKVQFVVASRLWCKFLEPLAKKAPDAVVCIGSFQECVLYSKSRMSVDFVKNENKLDAVLEFLEEVAGPKKTVIVCRYDEEVAFLEQSLKKLKYVVFSCNNTMTINDLYNTNIAWGKYEEPIIGAILVCCDDNLIHLNVTDAHYLIHYAMPLLFSTFSKRFSVLNDNYPSIFGEVGHKTRIKVLLEDTNAEQLPKILHFAKRCTNNIPDALNDVSTKVLACRDIIKAKDLVPLCDTMLSFGSCADFWNCKERHAILKHYDEPKDWMPLDGYINFKILHYHSADVYSARLLSNTVKGQTKKYPQTYSTLSLKMGMYFSKESNRKLHGVPKVGDVCAVSVKLNFFARCQVVKILDNYANGNPKHVLLRMIDEEKFERSRDIYLYYLPDKLREVQTYVIQVRLANIRPLDKDVTYSKMAKNELKKITESNEELYLRGQVALAVGNCVFVSTLEACQDLALLNDTVVRYNLKEELLNAHAELNPDHIATLEKLCKELKFKEKTIDVPDISSPLKVTPKCQWAHIDAEDLLTVFWSSSDNPDIFYVRIAKFNDCLHSLIKRIAEYVKDNPEPVAEMNVDDIVLAKFPDDDTYERARIDEVHEKTVKCFFVDHGDSRVIPKNHLVTIPDNFVTQLPFQAIECRLIGIKPLGNVWPKFCSDWFENLCLDASGGGVKQLYLKSFVKSKAEYTGGHKYGVGILDTNSEQDIIINQLMIDHNLAQVNEEESKYLDELTFMDTKQKSSESEKTSEYEEPTGLVVPFKKMSPGLIRSVPLVDSDDDFDDNDKWDINMIDDLIGMNKVREDKSDGNFNENYKEDVEKMAVVPINNFATGQPPEEVSKLKEDEKNKNVEKDINGLVANTKPENVNEAVILENKRINVEICDENQLSKPRLNWYQDKFSVTVKIQLIGAENYLLDIKDKSIKFSVEQKGIKYGFEFNLYGAVDSSKCSHCNKGQYILVNLTKLVKRNWLTLTRDPRLRKWIVYDADRLDTSSGDEDTDNSNLLNAIKNIHEKEASDSEDDDFADDVTFSNKRYT